ncbi:hypothetical protein RZE82_05420 [Mollicutes bacterium LVI A0039]|nr:hypothetical protein RZE82_05420 [Mollicutes bacterium LVI A0039]
MKFKSMKIEDSQKRQLVMANESAKEYVLYNQPMTWSAESNSEFVVGLPLGVRDYNSAQITALVETITAATVKVIPEPFVIAVHSKKLEDEVHFHISYQNIDVDHDAVKAQYENLV